MLTIFVDMWLLSLPAFLATNIVIGLARVVQGKKRKSNKRFPTTQRGQIKTICDTEGRLINSTRSSRGAKRLASPASRTTSSAFSVRAYKSARKAYEYSL